jgi:hypothetical protein
VTKGTTVVILCNYSIIYGAHGLDSLISTHYGHNHLLLFVVGIVTMLWVRWSGVQLPAGIRDFSLPEHPDLLLFNEWEGSFSGVRWLGHEIDHLPPSSAEVMSEHSSTSMLPVCFHGDDRDITFFTVPLLALKVSKRLSTGLDAYNCTPVDVTTSYNSVDRAAWLGKVTSQRHACRTIYNCRRSP